MRAYSFVAQIMPWPDPDFERLFLCGRLLLAELQQWTVVKGDDEMRTVAENNDRSPCELVLQQKIKDLLVDRREKNGALFDMFFANPDFQSGLMAYLAGTYDEFRREATV